MSVSITQIALPERLIHKYTVSFDGKFYPTTTTSDSPTNFTFVGIPKLRALTTVAYTVSFITENSTFKLLQHVLFGRPIGYHVNQRDGIFGISRMNPKTTSWERYELDATKMEGRRLTSHSEHVNTTKGSNNTGKRFAIIAAAAESFDAGMFVAKLVENKEALIQGAKVDQTTGSDFEMLVPIQIHDVEDDWVEIRGEI